MRGMLATGSNMLNAHYMQQGCLANNTNSATGCAVTDVKCLCSSIPYINALSCCLLKNCSPDDQRGRVVFDLDVEKI